MSITVPETDWGIHVEWLVDYLHLNGVALDEMSGILGRKIGNPLHCFLPIDDYLKLFAWGAERLSAPHLGLDIADQMQGSKLGILGYLIQNSPTVVALCENIERYQPIFMRGMEFSFRTSARQFEVQWRIFRPPSESVRQDVELTIAGFLQVLREAAGDSICPRKTLFSHACTEPAGRYEKTLGSEVFFEQDQNCLIFSADLMQLPLSDSDPKLLAILREHADDLLQKWEAKRSLMGQVKFLVATSLENNNSGVEMLASRLHITSRTLNRRLQQEGTNYQRLREDVIVELAKQSLEESDASITAIGGKLGYSESSAFVRAFKRLTGSTPIAYRNNARRGLG